MGHACPAPRAALRRVGDACDHLTTISDFTAARIAPGTEPCRPGPAASAAAPARPGLPRSGPARRRPEPTAPRPWSPSAGSSRRRASTSCSARGPAVVARPRSARPRLVLVGDGPQAPRCDASRPHRSQAGTVTFTGRPASPRPSPLSSGRRTCSRCRSGPGWAGLNPEGLGLAALEAAACGLPVLVGRSGGAPETVVDGVTGRVLPESRPATPGAGRCSPCCATRPRRRRWGSAVAPARPRALRPGHGPADAPRRTAPRRRSRTLRPCQGRRAPASPSTPSPTRSWRSSPTSTPTRTWVDSMERATVLQRDRRPRRRGRDGAGAPAVLRHLRARLRLGARTRCPGTSCAAAASRRWTARTS